MTFGSNDGGTPATLVQFFFISLSPYSIKPGFYPEIGHNRFIPHPFQLIILLFQLT
jgi:hypothetical protein